MPPGQFSLFSLDRNIFMGMFKSLHNLIISRECSLSRRHAICLAIGFGINTLLIAYGVVKQPGIATYLLYVFVANLLVYMGYYLTMKMCLHIRNIVVQRSFIQSFFQQSNPFLRMSSNPLIIPLL